MPGLRVLLMTLALSIPTQALAESEPELRLPEDLDQTLRRMMDALKPAMTEMFRLMEQFEGIDDPRHYQLPEVLPNGDIIIRRRPDAPPFRPLHRDGPAGDETRT